MYYSLHEKYIRTTAGKINKVEFNEKKKKKRVKNFIFFRRVFFINEYKLFDNLKTIYRRSASIISNTIICHLQI